MDIDILNMLYLGADHRGFALKESLKGHLKARGVAFEDFGADVLAPEDDYVAYAVRVADAVAADPGVHRGILACGSGIGMAVVANKIKGIRAGLVTELGQAIASRQDDDANVLVLEADTTTPEQGAGIVDQWLQTPFSGASRHRRRLENLQALENNNFK